MARTPRVKLNELYGDLTIFKGEPIDEIDRKLIACAQSLRDVIDEFIDKGWCDSLRDFGVAVGVPHSGLIRILTGASLPDSETIAKIEAATQRPIWSRQNRLRPDVMPPMFKERIIAVRDQKGARGVQVRFIDQINADRERLQQQEIKRRKKR